MQLTNKQRFHLFESNDRVFAALTLGCAANIYTIDRSVFKKSMTEKMMLFSMKKELGKTKHHKFVTQFKGSF
jgi:hypothetical protein